MDDLDVAQGLKARGCSIRWWGRMSVGSRRGRAAPGDEPALCSGGAVVRLSGVQSNAGGAALRLALCGAATMLPDGAPLWLCGLQEEGISDAPLALRGLFNGAEEIAGGGTACIYRAYRHAGSVLVPDASSFCSSVCLSLSEAGFADVEAWRVWPGLFAGGGLDVMTAFLLRRLRRVRIAAGAEVLDFCCGSGAIARAVLQLQPYAVVHLADADALAMDAACNNLAEVHGRLYLGDGWRPVPDNLVFDLILSNPPVHCRRQDDFRVVSQLIAGAAARLQQPYGRLWVVAQVHVPVGPMLESLGFRAKADSDGRFVLWRARVPCNAVDSGNLGIARLTVPHVAGLEPHGGHKRLRCL